jgi:response regulator NasT
MNEPLRIAVADDEQDMRDYYARILPRLGYDVVAICATGAALVEQCYQLHPDLVITDITMPDMDGLEASRLLKDENVPIILVTACADRVPVERADTVQPMGYLVKPIQQADLPPAIAAVMERRGTDS